MHGKHGSTKEKVERPKRMRSAGVSGLIAGLLLAFLLGAGGVYVFTVVNAPAYDAAYCTAYRRGANAVKTLTYDWWVRVETNAGSQGFKVMTIVRSPNGTDRVALPTSMVLKKEVYPGVTGRIAELEPTCVSEDDVINTFPAATVIIVESPIGAGGTPKEF